MSTHKDRENVKVVCDRLAKLKEKKGNRDKKGEKMRNASGQQGENEWSEKKSEQEHKQQNFFRNTYNIFFIKRVTRKFNVTTTTAKKCKKECATR